MPRRRSLVSNDFAVAQKWQAAVYIRLSREDGDGEESDSVHNQREFLCEFLGNEDDIELHDVYVDDGYTGTNFERPAFVRLMDDIKGKHVNCVVVKDLSRFGRNYIDVGNYIEKVFPMMDIRFVSVNDGLDSYKNPNSTNNLIVPFKNIINDEYCRDISNKVRTSLDLKRRQGKFIGSFASYGYLKDPNDRNRLVVDEEAAAVVRDIFAWFIGGMGVISIAKKLNALGVQSPAAYKKAKGFNYRNPSSEQGISLWNERTIRRMLENPLYTGTLVQGRNKVKSYKVQVSVAQAPDKWIVVEDTHEAIIDNETFEKVQGLLIRDARTPKKQHKLNVFAGFIKCADCKRAMNRKHISQPYGDYSYYMCKTFKKTGSGCTKHSIRADKLEHAVLVTVQQRIRLALDMDKLVAQIANTKRYEPATARLERLISEKEAETARIESYKLSLYPDWKNGDLTKEEYTALRTQYDEQLKVLSESITQMKDEVLHDQNGVDETNKFLAGFTRHNCIENLTRELVADLINNVYVHEDGSITIDFRFEDDFAKVMEFVEKNNGLISAS